MMEKTFNRETVKNLLFDLGGVLLDIDYQRPVDAFARIGYPHFEQAYAQETAQPLFHQLEVGAVDETTFLKTLQSWNPKPVPLDAIRDAWNSILLDFRFESLRFLQQLRSQYPTYLLSNTNFIHQAAYEAIYRQQIGPGSLSDCFHKAYYSQEIGRRKPDASAYQYVLEDARIRAADTLFIDDTISNIRAAVALGFQTYWLEKGERIETVLSDFVTA
jgi:putative hydrolase of the HAD superfamily